MANDVRINGNAMSWGSVICRLNGIEQHWLVSISYSEKRERGKVYGMGRHHSPRGRSSGKYSVENVKIKGPKTDVQGFLEYLAGLSNDGISYGNVKFPLFVQYVEDSATVTDEIVDCVVASVADTAEESVEGIMTEVELDAMYLVRNGKTLFDSSPI